MKKKQMLCSVVIITFITVVMMTVALLLYSIGWISPTDLSSAYYCVKGVDVSSYQGYIDWQVLPQDIDFVYIKATEGSSSTDEQFLYNWQEVQKTNIRAGAYHFFSFDSSGKTQAEHFIATVAAFDKMLPPVIDVEFYADKEIDPPSRQIVHKQINIMVSMIEKHYGMKPIFYATRKSFDMYLSGNYMEYDIWIRDILCRPLLSDGRQWTFWQYSEKGYIKGYSGEENFIDLNVFNGSKSEFYIYPKQS